MIALHNLDIGILHLNSKQFGSGDFVCGYLSLACPCSVRVTLRHIEQCGDNKYISDCCTAAECCWYLQMFKIPFLFLMSKKSIPSAF